MVRFGWGRIRGQSEWVLSRCVPLEPTGVGGCRPGRNRQQRRRLPHHRRELEHRPARMHRQGWRRTIGPHGILGVLNGADAFPQDVTQWKDSDQDGYGDNPLGSQPDRCPTVPGASTLGWEAASNVATTVAWIPTSMAIPTSTTRVRTNSARVGSTNPPVETPTGTASAMVRILHRRTGPRYRGLGWGWASRSRLG